MVNFSTRTEPAVPFEFLVGNSTTPAKLSPCISCVDVRTSEELDDTAGCPASSAARLAGPVGVGVHGNADFGRFVVGDGFDVGPDAPALGVRPDGPGAGAVGGPAGVRLADGGAAGDGDAAPGSASFFPPPNRLCQKSTMPPTMSVTMLPPCVGDADGEGAGDGDPLGLAEAPPVRVWAGALLLVRGEAGEADGDLSAIVRLAAGPQGAADAGEAPPATYPLTTARSTTAKRAPP